jgi:acetyl-CoA carboxylase biotin carboxylase subunit
MLRALDEYVVHGVSTNIEFLKATLGHPEFIGGKYDTGVVDLIMETMNARVPSDEEVTAALIGAALDRHFSDGDTTDAAAAPATKTNNWQTYARMRAVGRV